MLNKFPSDKMNDTKNAHFFLSRAPTHHSFTFNSRFQTRNFGHESNRTHDLHQSFVTS